MSKHIIETITTWLKKQLKQSDSKGYVLGLSGGLDSSVCAALIQRAGMASLGLILPIESHVDDCDDAAMVASTFSMNTQYIDLSAVYRTMINVLTGKDRIAQGNIKARLRMVVLYYYANIHNYLVCGTGNRTELMLGYFTKFGDGACDVLPLGDLYKFQVQKIAKTLGVPEKIINKIPSAGLWQGQTDEQEIGYTYKEMDQTLQEIVACRASGKCAQKLQDMIACSEHKRQLPKICRIKSDKGHLTPDTSKGG